jgi:ABC-type multidrug transport system fused ATPase/permease subunit
VKQEQHRRRQHLASLVTATATLIAFLRWFRRRPVSPDPASVRMGSAQSAGNEQAAEDGTTKGETEMPDTSTTAPDRESVAGLIGEVERTVRERRDAYRKRARWHSWFFRASGIGVIAIASALPVLASLSYAGKTLTVSIAGALVAFLTALRSFYQWDQLWGLLRQSDLDISHLLEKWKLDVAATAALSEQERRSRVHTLATELLEQTEAIRRAESQSYFAALRFPQGAQAGSPR